MDAYIAEMFDSLVDEKIDLFSQFFKESYIILARSEKFHEGGENEKYERLFTFYNVLNETQDLKTARIDSGFNFKQAMHYIDFLNMAFVNRFGKPFYSKKLDTRKRR